MADDAQFLINLVTPERILLAGMASEVVLRTAEGDITILNGHAPLVGSVETGVVRVTDEEGNVQRVACRDGFIQVDYEVPIGDETGNRVTLLVGVALLVEEIDEAGVRAELEAAESALALLTGSGRSGETEDGPDLEFLAAEGEVQWAEVRLEALDAESSHA